MYNGSWEKGGGGYLGRIFGGYVPIYLTGCPTKWDEAITFSTSEDALPLTVAGIM